MVKSQAGFKSRVYNVTSEQRSQLCWPLSLVDPCGTRIPA